MSEEYLTDPNYHEVAVTYQGETLRFWLPGNRPVRQLIEAIVRAGNVENAQAPYFSAPLPLSSRYALLSADGSRAELDSDQTLRLLNIQGTGEHFELVLLPGYDTQEIPQAYLLFADHYLQPLHGHTVVIGYSREGYRPDVDVRPIMQNLGNDEKAGSKIARRHAEITITSSGLFFLRLLSPNGLAVNGQRLEPGERRYRLERGMILDFSDGTITAEFNYD